MENLDMFNGTVEWSSTIIFQTKEENNRMENQQNNGDIVYVVSECLFAFQDRSRWWVDSGATCHIVKSKERVLIWMI